MNQPASVRVTVLVDVLPAIAFQVFTEETAAWYRPAIAGAPARSGGHLRFDPAARRVMRVGGTTDDVVEVGRITMWEPGQRLIFVDRHETEVDVQFERSGDQTRVTLEHRGLERLPPGDALSAVQYGWRRLAFQFEAHLQQREEERT
jgi:hypothetical protein